MKKTEDNLKRPSKTFSNPRHGPPINSSETVKLAEGRVIAVPADVSDRASVKALVRSVEFMLGPVNLLVNNAAAGGPFGPFWESNPEDWWRCQEVNLRRPMLCCRELLGGMIARQAGRIINVVSGAGCRAYPDMSAYVASKTALIRLSEQLALELKPHGVSVFPIMPGLVRTVMSRKLASICHLCRNFLMKAAKLLRRLWLGWSSRLRRVRRTRSADTRSR